jgi:hypothetical protein
MGTGQLERERGRSGLARWALAIGGLFVGLVSFEQPVHAQTAAALDATDASPRAGSAPRPVGCNTGRDATSTASDSVAAFDRFQCTLAEQDYAGALEILESVCGARDAACAFNRALVYHAWLERPEEGEGEHCQLARRNYLAFLDLDPYSEQRAAAAGALRELEQFCPLAPVALAPAPQLAAEGIPALGAERSRSAVAAAVRLEPAPARLEQPGLRITAGRTLLGVGSALAAAAALSWLRMARADADLLAQRQPDGSISRTQENEALDETRHVYQRWAWGLGIGASALLGTGALLLLIDQPAAPSWSGAIGPGFLGASYGTVF